MTEQKKDTLGDVQVARHKLKTALAHKAQLEKRIDKNEAVYDTHIEELHARIPKLVQAIVDDRQTLEETDLSLEKLETDLRDALDAHYDETGVKSPFGDKSGYISRPMKYTITDDDKMIEWAKANKPELVKTTEKLDKKGFNKWVKDVFTEDEQGFVDMDEDFEGLPVEAGRVNQVNVSIDTIVAEIEAEEEL